MSVERSGGLQSLITGAPPRWASPVVVVLLAATAGLAQVPGYERLALGPGLLAALIAPLWLTRIWWLACAAGLAAAAAVSTSSFVLSPESGSAAAVVLVCAALAGAVVTTLVHQVHSAHSALLRQNSDFDRAAREAKAHEEALRLKLAYASSHDSLTGLYDRAAFLHQLEGRLSTDEPLGVAVIGMSGFAELNDSLGHDVGDRVLVEVADRLRHAGRDSDLVARLGGDVFAVLYPGVSVETAVQVGKRLNELLLAPFDVDGRLMPLRARIGVACANVPGLSASEVLRRGELTSRATAPGAPAGIWEANTLGGQNRVELEADLQRGLLANEFFVLYQPLISTTDGTISSVEALVRWQHPERGMVPPDEFIFLAERSGLIVPLGMTVLEMACLQLREWAGAGKGLGLTVAVNVSARQLIEPDFVVKVRQILFNSGVDPRQIVLELTESMLVDDSDAAIGVLWQLRSLGVRLAIDDFGTGYSSLARLGEMPVDELKIDKSFVDRLGTKPHDSTALVTAAVAMGHGLNLEVVAEGVETAQQAAMLCSVGCDLLQGYLLGRPQRGSDITPQLGQRLLDATVPGPRTGSLPAQDPGRPNVSVPGVAPSLAPQAVPQVAPPQGRA
jgi:diguanylate cyclase (GGDEF)-like protein